MPPINTTQNKTICIPSTPEKYEEIIDNPSEFRSYLDDIINLYPELFPVCQMTIRYRMSDN